MATRYPVGTSLQQTCALLKISPERVLRRVGLSASLAGSDELSVEVDGFFDLWDASIAEADRPDAVRQLAMAYAHGPFLPPLFAFSCADTLALGLTRLADFKPLIGPVVFDLSRDHGQLTLDIKPAEPGRKIPASMGLFELIYITECARCFSGHPITPVATRLPDAIAIEAETLDLLGRAPRVGGSLQMVFSAEDADRPLITRSPSLWETLEPGLLDALHAQEGRATMTARIRRALTEALPGGSSSVEDMARRLNVSKRSLQRRLSEEGTNFQEILNATRHQMSERYLKDTGLSVPEISYLLGFRDASSFFRAFHGWTGMTPGDYRSTKPQAPEPRIH